MKRALPKPRDDDDKQVLRDIAKDRCHIVGVLADEEGPSFAYSIGLFHNYGHPEILMFGLSHELMQIIINSIAESASRDERVIPNVRDPSILKDVDCEFRTVHVSHYRDLFGYARWVYQGEDFPALQCFWPDKQGRFPWDDGCSAEVRVLQPVHEKPWKVIT